MPDSEQFDDVANQRRRLEEAQALARVGSWELDLRTGETTWSRQLHRIFGTDPETLVTGPETYLDYVHPDDRPGLDADAQTLFGGADSVISRYRLIRADDGELRYVEAQVRLDRSNQGEPTSIRGTTMDVTDNHRLEQERVAALRELAHAKAEVEQREKLLEEAQSLAGVGSWSVDLETGVVTWSTQMHRLYATDPATTQLTRDSYLDFLEPQDRSRIQQAIGEVMTSGQSALLEQVVIRADGERRIMLGRARADRNADGRIVRISGTTQDVTDARQLERARMDAASALARANEELARQSIDLAEAQRIAGVGSWSYDVDSGVMDSSAQMRRMCERGQPPGFQLTARTYLSLIHPDDRDRVSDAVRDALATGKPFELEFRVPGPAGTISTFRSRARVEMRDGRATRMSGTAQDVTDERRAARAEAYARLELEEAQRLTGIGSWSFEPATGELTWSPQMHRIFGTDAVDGFTLTMAAYHEMVHPDDQERLNDVALAAMVSGEPYQIEHRIVRVDGAERLMLARGQAELGEQGQPIRFSGTGQDVTDARRAEREQAQARADLEEAQRIAGVGSWTADLVTGETNWSAQMHRIFGTDPATFVPTMENYLAFFAPAERAQIDAAMFAALSSGNDYEHEHRLTRRDGTEVILAERAHATIGDNGHPIRIGGTAQDVTDARRIQHELVEARDLFQQVLSAATDQAILGIDQDGRLTLFNKGAESMLGYSSEEMLGQSPWAILRAPEYLARIADGGDVDLVYLDSLSRRVGGVGDNDEGDEGDEGGDLRRRLPGQDEDRDWLCKNGDVVVVQTSITPMRNHDGEVTGYLCIATDVTERRQAERARDRAEQEVQEAMLEISDARDEALAANQAKSAFLATMSHEIRTPMNAVIGMTGLLLDTQLDDDQRDLLETVRGSGDQLLAIINDILDFSKIEAGDLDLECRAFDLHDLVEGTVAQFAGAARGLDLLSHVDDACPVSVIGDVTRLRQVLSNLVSNAIKFTSQGDVLVHVTSQEQEDDKINLLFQVRDTGIGIPPESMHRLFKSFSQVDASTTRTYGGTGLGLAISRALVTAMGGDIWVESTLGEGSTFSFNVQLSQDDAEPVAKPGAIDAPSLRAALAGRRVLIVDDNATNRRILQMQLASYGALGIEAAGSVEALQVLSDADHSFDLAVLDLVMPVLDGVQLAGAIRRLPGREQLPIVLLSSIGRRLAEDEDTLFSAVLTKPVRSVPLMESLARAIAPSSAVESIPAPSRPRDDSTAAPRDGIRILLAEDNEVNQKVGRLMLSKLGYTTDIVSNGEEALAAALERDYDVILMDMHMPVMDGLEATRRIRTEVDPLRQPTIIAMTASVTMEDREACAEAGMNDYLPKPVRADDLAAVLEQASHV